MLSLLVRRSPSRLLPSSPSPPSTLSPPTLRAVVTSLEPPNLVVADGQTGSGKSWTMMGVEPHPGLIRSTGNFLFDFADRWKRGEQAGVDMTLQVTISCVEIYNEQIRDLLRSLVKSGGIEAIRAKHNIKGATGLAPIPPPPEEEANKGPQRPAKLQRKPSISRKPQGGMFKRGTSSLGIKSMSEREAELKIRESASKGVYVEGLSTMSIEAHEELTAVIKEAIENRAVRSTNMNDESSR